MNRIDELLDAREKRVEFQKNLVLKFKLPLIVLRCNYPGVNKDNKITREIVNIMDKAITNTFECNIEFKTVKFSCEGPIVFIIVKEDSYSIKRKCIDIEEKHMLGRIVDIDVFDSYYKGISRRELGYDMRKCFICSSPAHICVRSRKHTEKEVVEFIKQKLEQYY